MIGQHHLNAMWLDKNGELWVAIMVLTVQSKTDKGNIIAGIDSNIRQES